MSINILIYGGIEVRLTLELLCLLSFNWHDDYLANSLVFTPFFICIYKLGSYGLINHLLSFIAC